MEISNVVRHPYFFLLPIGFVIVCAVLVFAFGFKSSVEPNFRPLSDRYPNEEKRGKKRKFKDKKNISTTAGSLENLFINQEHRASYSKKFEARFERRYGSDLLEKPKFKKISKDFEKPIDYDDGEWETAFSRKDKKNRKKDGEKVQKSSGPIQKNKETNLSNKVRTEHKMGGKGKPVEMKDSSDASLFAVTSLERMENMGYPVMGHNKKKKKLRKD